MSLRKSSLPVAYTPPRRNTLSFAMRRLHPACLLLALLASACRAAAAPAPQPSGPLTSMVFPREHMGILRTANGEIRSVTDRPTATLGLLRCELITLNPDQAAHPPHRHAEEKVIVVQSGRLEVNHKGATQVCGPGSVILCAWNDTHAVRNPGESPATFWVITPTSARTHDPYALNRTPTLGSVVRDWESLPVKSTPTAQRREILQGSTATLDRLAVHATTVPARTAAHGAHRHPDDEIVLVLEGTMEATLDGRGATGGPGSLFLFTSGDLHGLRNSGETAAIYVIIRIVTPATPAAPAGAR